MDAELTDEIHRALSQLIQSGQWYHYTGEAIDQLTYLVGQHCQRQRIMLCGSGTIAMELALRGLLIEAGDEVILAAYDYPGNFRSIEAVNGQPVLVDIAPGSWSIDAQALEAARSEKTRAVIASHLHGSCADMPSICRWASEHGIAVIEDACQAHGAIIHGRPAGSWGDLSTLSFGGSKLISAGRGGAVMTNSDRIAQRIHIYRDRGNDAFPLSLLQACAILPQWHSLDRLNRKRADAVQTLMDQRDELPGITLPPVPPDGCQPAFYKFPLMVNPMNEVEADARTFGQREPQAARDRCVMYLQSQSVQCGEGFRGFLRKSSRRCRIVGDLKRSRKAAEETLLIHHTELMGSQAGLRLVELLRPFG